VASSAARDQDCRMGQIGDLQERELTGEFDRPAWPTSIV